MHPVITNKKILATYIFIWIIFALTFASFLANPFTSKWLYALLYTLPLFLIYGSICLSAWYLCKFFPIQKTGITKIIFIFSTAAFVNSSIWLLIGIEWAALLDRFIDVVNEASLTVVDTHLKLIFGVTLYLLSGAGHYLIILFDESQAAQRKLIEMNTFAREAELKALRSQINPHFLFNSLNSISALTATDPKSARRMTELLAEFFRKSLDAGKQKFVTLREELELASYYLNIEKIRFGKRLAVDIQVDEECLEKTVPPLILQPLVENAVKHGIAHLIGGGTITIKSRCGMKSLTVTVENPCDPDRPKGTGNRLGLENIRHRLNAIYDSKSDVITRDEITQFKAEVIIKDILQQTDSK
jgi:two-component system, LytTR family, sensor histidine kinase AlgZ